MAEFGLALCDDGGEGLEIDGVVGRVEPHMVNVVIKKLTTSSSICGPREGAVSRRANKVGLTKEPPQISIDVWREGEEPPAVKPWQLRIMIESQKPLH